jgi:hypothetical protein
MTTCRIFAACSVVTILLTACTSRARADIEYTFTNLGSLGGTYDSASGINDAGQIVGNHSMAQDINDAGRIVGYASFGGTRRALPSDPYPRAMHPKPHGPEASFTAKTPQQIDNKIPRPR